MNSLSIKNTVPNPLHFTSIMLKEKRTKMVLDSSKYLKNGFASFVLWFVFMFIHRDCFKSSCDMCQLKRWSDLHWRPLKRKNTIYFVLEGWPTLYQAPIPVLNNWSAYLAAVCYFECIAIVQIHSVSIKKNFLDNMRRIFSLNHIPIAK